MIALRRPAFAPRDLDRAFATVCVNEDVEFPAGDARSARTRSRHCVALEQFWEKLPGMLPSTDRQRNDVHDSAGGARHFAASCA